MSFKAQRTVVAQVPFQHVIHDLWWSRRARRDAILTDWNRKHRIAFIHTPKCAGTSVFASLRMPAPEIGSHIPIKAYYVAAPDQAPRLDTFTFVRNPWDRFVSAFHYLAFHATGAPDRAFAKSFLGEQPEFEGFLEKFASRGWYRRGVMGHPHFRPQTHYVYSSDKQLRPKYIFKIEDGFDQIVQVAALAGLDADPTSENRSDRNAYKNYFDDVGKQAIGDAYAEDAMLFGYEFQ